MQSLTSLTVQHKISKIHTLRTRLLDLIAQKDRIANDRVGQDVRLLALQDQLESVKVYAVATFATRRAKIYESEAGRTLLPAGPNARKRKQLAPAPSEELGKSSAIPTSKPPAKKPKMDENSHTRLTRSSSRKNNFRLYGLLG
ncbi:hypothetical protein B0H13DRAFT_1921544 [Mycena leptocephala]|nr:hypothetical protein B0H13DRAFT_1921544 [Mycena leptocephala]